MNSTLRNPFQPPFTMERVRTPTEFFQYFSSGVLDRVCSKLAEPLSHFVVGPNGCGKTTCLRFLQYRNQTHITLSPQLRTEFADLQRQLPQQFVGIYYTIRMGPISQFAGRDIEPLMWARMYGNYLNYVMVEECVRFLDWCRNPTHEDWAEKQGIDIPRLHKLLEFGLNEVVGEAGGKVLCHKSHG